MSKNKGGQNKSNEENGNYQQKKTTVKVYDLNSDYELNGDFGTEDHNDEIGNNNEEHIPRAKGRPIKKKKRKKTSSPTVK